MSYFPRNVLESTLDGIKKSRVALIGDFCLDVYWRADMKRSELSRETPHYPLPIISERYSLGGAGNVAANIMSLQPKSLITLGVLGKDWRGTLLKEALQEKNIDCSRLLVSDKIITNAYIKPQRSGISDTVYEDPRIDFENYAPLPDELSSALYDALNSIKDDFDILLVSDQLQFGCISPALREAISHLGQEGKTVVVDSRKHIANYHHVIVKPNEVEASQAFSDGHALTPNEMYELTSDICNRNNAPAIITAGANGHFVADNSHTWHCPARKVDPPIDIVGAGDTFLAAFGCAFGGGASLTDAARFASVASSITIKKLGTTGTVSAEEFYNLYNDMGVMI